LAQVEVDRAELLLQARASNAGFAGDVEQLVEKIRVHARHLDTLGLTHGLALRRNGQRRSRSLVTSPLRQASKRNGYGDRSRRRHGWQSLDSRRLVRWLSLFDERLRHG